MNEKIPKLYKPSWVANTFLQRAEGKEEPKIDPLKIQKLVYCLHGWHLSVTGDPAVGEQFEAWPKGPVLPSLYHCFKQFRWGTIKSLAKDTDPETGEERAGVIDKIDKRFHEILDAVWERYKGFTGAQLSALTHAEGTPWDRAKKEGLIYIPDTYIKQHFDKLGGKTSA